MPRFGYSRTDPITIRPGYVSQYNDPVDRRGGPETHSGRLDHGRMNERASPDTFMPSLDARSRDLHILHARLFSSTAADSSDLPSRDDLHRSEPSLELERRSRGYNLGYFGRRVSSYGSSPQLGGLDHGYRDQAEGWPRGTPIKTDFDDYKRKEERSDRLAKEYRVDEKTWKKSRGSTNYLPPHLRDEDGFDRRQSLTATNISKSYQSVAEKRNNHNNDYIGHWPREKRRGHKRAVKFDKDRADEYSEESQRHVDSRNGRWRDQWQADMDELYPEDD